MKNLIGISGKMGSGKDTVALIIQYLTDEYATKDDLTFSQWYGEKEELPNEVQYTASPFIIKKFAGKLKDIVCLLIGCTRADLENDDFKNTPLSAAWDESHGINTPRELLQVLGTDCGRDMIHPNIWVNALFADYKHTKCFYDPEGEQVRMKGLPDWLVTDMRFPNEAKAIEERDGLTIRVHTTRAGKVSNHESETALDSHNFDYVVDNSGSVQDLVDKIKVILVNEKIM
jgi:hypothetical protein